MINNSTFFVALSIGAEAKSFKKEVIRCSRVYMRVVWQYDHCVCVCEYSCAHRFASINSLCLLGGQNANTRHGTLFISGHTHPRVRTQPVIMSLNLSLSRTQ